MSARTGVVTSTFPKHIFGVLCSASLWIMTQAILISWLCAEHQIVIESEPSNKSFQSLVKIGSSSRGIVDECR